MYSPLFSIRKFSYNGPKLRFLDEKLTHPLRGGGVPLFCQLLSENLVREGGTHKKEFFSDLGFGTLPFPFVALNELQCNKLRFIQATYFSMFVHIYDILNERQLKS